MYFKNKFHAKKCICQSGHLHDSKKESNHCDRLHMLQKCGAIQNLRIQVKYDLIPAQKFQNMKSERACQYTADFVYDEKGITIIEDTKGVKTKDYIIKRKLMKLKYCDDDRIIFREV